MMALISFTFLHMVKQEQKTKRTNKERTKDGFKKMKKEGVTQGSKNMSYYFSSILLFI